MVLVMATAKRRSQPQDIFLPIVLIGVVGAGVAFWYGFPGLPVIWAAGLTAAWTKQPPVLTGKKDADGYPAPANAAEERNLAIHRVVKGLQTSLILPLSDLMPGWPIRASWLAAIWAGVVGFLVPVTGNHHMTASTGRWLDAVAAAFVVAALTGSARRAQAGHPGTRVDALRRLVVERPAVVGAALVLGAALGSAVGVALVKLASRYGSGFGAGPHHTHPGITIHHPAAVIAVLAIGGAGFALAVPWRRLALADWRAVAGARSTWVARWTALRQSTDVPVLIAHTEPVPSVTCDTFEAPSHIGVVEFLKLEAKLAPMVGPGVRVAAMSCPDVTAAGPTPGSWSGTQFRVVCWPASWHPEPSTDPEIVRLWVESAMAWTAHGVGVYPEPALVSIENLVTSTDDDGATSALDQSPQPGHLLGAVTAVKAALARFWTQVKESAPTESTLAKALAEDTAGSSQDVATPSKDDKSSEIDFRSEHEGITAHVPAIWRTMWAWRPNLDARYFRVNMTEAFVKSLASKAVVDHRNGAVYFGTLDVLTDDSDGTGVPDATATFIRDRLVEDEWRPIWTHVLKSGTNLPNPQPRTARTAQLVNGSTVHRLAFVVNEGNNPREYKGVDENLQTAKPGTTFVVTTGWPDVSKAGRPGDRHPQALCLYWSYDPVPLTPKWLEPSTSIANQWVLSAIVNRAFGAAKLPAPEVIAVRPLTTPSDADDNREHAWEVKLRLYGGVTSSQVRGQGGRIAETLGISWVRVTDIEDGCALYMGTHPSTETLRRPADATLVAFLDWEQAYLSSGVVGSSGRVPQLESTSHLPANPAVEVLEFSLPSGLDKSMVRAGIPKLRTATGNAFVEVTDSETGPSHIRVLASRENPLPMMVPFDFDAADSTTGWAFATGVDGEPVTLTPGVDPHAMVVGGTGSGKTVTAQDLIYGAVIRGCEIHIIDPMKAAADFKAFEPYARSFAVTITDAAAALRAIYAEVEQRKTVNAAHGVGSYRDLPDGIRPPHILVMVDEFTSLIASESPPRSPFDDPDLEAERQEQLAVRDEKRAIGTLIGKIAREARSAGVSLVLGTQKLMAKSLDDIPGGASGDLKTNLARILLGVTSSGDRMSALRAFDQAPDLGTPVPKGRGIWESTVSSGVVIQTWFASPDALSANLAKRIQPLAEEDRLDLTPFRKRRDRAPGVVEVEPEPEDEGTDDPDEPIDLGEIELSLDDLEDQGGEPIGATPEADGPEADHTESGGTGWLDSDPGSRITQPDTDDDWSM
jgi:hypothetical protein